MSATTITSLQQLKAQGHRFACLTAYDATFAHQVAAAGIPLILVGDSLGMVIQGQESTLPVNVDEMIYHTRAVRKGSGEALVMADLPFMSYHNEALALANAARLMAEGGAHMVKLEGGRDLVGRVRRLSECGIPVCAHLGLLPQSVNKLGGYKVQGRNPHEATEMIEAAGELERAGADMLLLECVPQVVAREITASLTIPVIGIGAGPYCDSQVLVLHDLLGISQGKSPRFVKDFMAEAGTIGAALVAYREAVEGGTFPAPEHCFE